MIKALLSRPVAVCMFYFAVVLLGVISYLNLSIEGQPDTELPQLVVEAAWPNTSPEVIQVFLTSPIEEVAAQLDGVEELNSSSTRRGSSITIKFDRDTDMEFARLDLNERLAKLRADLPRGASQPQIRMVETGPLADTAFLTFNVSGPYDLQILSEIVKEGIKDDIGSLEGVADVTIFGEREKQLKVSLDRKAMDLYGIVPETVFAKILQLTRTYETSRTQKDNQEFTMTITNSIGDLAAVEDLVISQRGDQTVRVRDLGRVQLGYAKMQSLSRLNGNPTLRITVEKEVGANVISTARRVRQTVEQKLPALPAGIRVDWVVDEGQLMQEQLDSVYQRGIWCVILIVILLLLFLSSFTAACVITLNILFSVLITINFMYYFGVTFNIVTLSGLAIGFGMLVDNAIVVLENIFRYRESGMGRMEAARRGAAEVAWAILAATLTTVAAFLCMVFLKDRLAVSYWPLAVAVIFSLSASLLVSFTFTPVLSLLIRRTRVNGTSAASNPIANFIRRCLDRFSDGYETLVNWTLKHKMLILVIVGALFWMFWRIYDDEIDKGGFTFGFGRDDMLFVRVRMPEGAELQTADDVIRQFEEPVLALKGEGTKDVEVAVYQNVAFMRVTFEPEMLASAFPLALKARLIEIAQGFAGVGIGVMGINNEDNYFSGFTGFETYNSSIRLLGFNYKKLMDYGNEILGRVKRNRRVKSTKLETTRSQFGSRDQTETVLAIDRESLRHYDIDIHYLLEFISRNLDLESRARTKYQGEELLLEVKFEDADHFDIKALEALVVRTTQNQRIRLADLVHLETRKVSGGIDRKDQQYMVNVRWDYRGSAKKARTFNEAVFASLELPPGFKAELDFTEFLSREESKNLLFIAGLAVLVVFMIIAALYESLVDPLVIFSTIPLAFIGVSWIYWFTGNSFDSTAYVGLIILAGIVVNNSILLVSHINDTVRALPARGADFNQAIAVACRDRLRPVLLTAITTIVGLLPLLEEFVTWFLGLPGVSHMLHWLSIDATAGNLENMGLQTTLSMFSSLSRSTVGGMLSATISTLLIIPVVYAVLFRFKQWLFWRIKELFELSDEILKNET